MLAVSALKSLQKKEKLRSYSVLLIEQKSKYILETFTFQKISLPAYVPNTSAFFHIFPYFDRLWKFTSNRA